MTSFKETSTPMEDCKATTVTTPVAAVVNTLSHLIGNALSEMESERTNPGFDPDSMDNKIKFARERAVALRKLRQDFEDEMAKQPQHG